MGTAAISRTPNGATTERRKSRRFPIELELHYVSLRPKIQLQTGSGKLQTGSGKTVNISSSGILFSSDRELAVGIYLEVSISWPVPLTDKCLLSLVVCGRVVRSCDGLVAVVIQSHEFHIRKPV